VVSFVVFVDMICPSTALRVTKGLARVIEGLFCPSTALRETKRFAKASLFLFIGNWWLCLRICFALRLRSG
jgi:hypothetical protein